MENRTKENLLPIITKNACTHEYEGDIDLRTSIQAYIQIVSLHIGKMISQIWILFCIVSIIVYVSAKADFTLIL